MIQAYFSQIKPVIMQYIEEATSEICIAVAWFTHRDLFDAILKALDRKIRVSVILIDDIINRGPNGLDFAVFISKGGMVRFMNTRKLLMHNKFCLFDGKTLITGSYNWTYSAEMHNAENIIVTDEANICIAFREQFMILWDDLPTVEQYRHLAFNEITSEDIIKGYDYIHEEFESMKSIDVISQDSITQLEVLKQSTSHPKAYITQNLGISLINDQVLTIIFGNDPFEIPFHGSVEICTTADKQDSIISNIVYGNSIKASENKIICTFGHQGLPIKMAGEVNIIVSFHIDSYLDLYVKSRCVINGTDGLPCAPTNIRDIVKFRG